MLLDCFWFSEKMWGYYIEACLGDLERHSGSVLQKVECDKIEQRLYSSLFCNIQLNFCFTFSESNRGFKAVPISQQSEKAFYRKIFIMGEYTTT